MRIFAVSDIHIDYKKNRIWLHSLSKYDYKEDILILAGDVSDIAQLLEEGFRALKDRFYEVLYVPGNHDLWVQRNKDSNSMERFYHIKTLAENYGILMKPYHFESLSIVPLFSWYDYTFGKPSDDLYDIWLDYSYCKWPNNLEESEITNFFHSLNVESLDIKNRSIISFSHFLPRIDLMPSIIPQSKRIIYPTLGSLMLEEQIRRLGSDIHIYGHSHVNMHISKEKILYINNAFGYPSET
ncbi:MAG: metallophosphoesterase family protein, partial [Spirochaetota bacterium]|nr:metallophosphoesterase family protein [Spirochaetota bacterium]